LPHCRWKSGGEYDLATVGVDFDMMRVDFDMMHALCRQVQLLGFSARSRYSPKSPRLLPFSLATPLGDEQVQSVGHPINSQEDLRGLQGNQRPGLAAAGGNDLEGLHGLFKLCANGELLPILRGMQTEEPRLRAMDFLFLAGFQIAPHDPMDFLSVSHVEQNIVFGRASSMADRFIGTVEHQWLDFAGSGVYLVDASSVVGVAVGYEDEVAMACPGEVIDSVDEFALQGKLSLLARLLGTNTKDLLVSSE
jgi:hypothetical protein